MDFYTINHAPGIHKKYALGKLDLVPAWARENWDDWVHQESIGIPGKFRQMACKLSHDALGAGSLNSLQYTEASPDSW